MIATPARFPDLPDIEGLSVEVEPLDPGRNNDLASSNL